jgi:hypothetical protein
MITLYTNKNTLIQLHKTEVASPLKSSCFVRVKASLGDKETILEASVQELEFCYILSITENIDVNSLNATLEVRLDADSIEPVYTSNLAIKEYSFPVFNNIVFTTVLA